MFQSLNQWFSTTDDLVMFGDILGWHNWGGATSIEQVEARDTVKQPTGSSTALHSKELAGQKYK